MDKLVNTWGYITSINIEHGFHDSIYVPNPETFGDFMRVGQIKDVGTITFEGSAPATPEIIAAITNWARNGKGRLPSWSEEWMCLYCGTPQPLLNRKCDDCGAPRNWLIG